MSLAHTLGSAVNGGAEAYFVSLVGAFARAGIAQHAAIRAHAGREAALAAFGVPTRVLPFGKTFDFTTTPAIAAMAREGDARIILAWMNRAASATPRGPWKRVGRLGGYYKLKNYRDYDALVGNTQDIVDWMVREGWPKERAHYIPNFAAPGDGGRVDRAALETPDDAPLLLGMGRLHQSKAHDVSLRALQRLPEAYLWIAGDGPEEEALKAEAQSLGVAERVRFLGWRDDAASLYRSADVVVFPSRFEPLGNVVIQAWAHGVPIVAARAAGPGALIRDGGDGFLIEIDDAEALAAKTRALLVDPSLRQSFIQAGAERVAGEFSESAVVAHWRALFDSLGGV
ncbi:MAG TPA: glycosyltransferase [Vitreimonas sp.]|uniref:glycosyltransferase n=1 Tax=Vitreimonas sp. TaxID=3069702 RepID=UPI002D595E09|nr:glycosyltransferase [Vitreimonas sp.]HYD87588.1 glycosyltransferase [Vitreimonas sp.]